MKKVIFVGFVLMVLYNKLFANCDTSFFNFQRLLIKIASESVDSAYVHDSLKGITCFQFSNFAGHNYVVGDPNSPVGFFLFRVDTCDLFPRKDTFQYIKSIKFQLAPNYMFEGFMTADEFWDFDLHKVHTFSQVVGDPVEGWSIIEEFFFRRKADYSRPAERPTRSLLIAVPIYTFKDRQLVNAFLVTIELSGITRDDIKISNVKKNAF